MRKITESSKIQKTQIESFQIRWNVISICSIYIYMLNIYDPYDQLYVKKKIKKKNVLL